MREIFVTSKIFILNLYSLGLTIENINIFALENINRFVCFLLRYFLLPKVFCVKPEKGQLKNTPKMNNFINAVFKVLHKVHLAISSGSVMKFWPKEEPAIKDKNQTLPI